MELTEKDYVVNVQFRVTGMLPDMVTVKHIQENIAEEIMTHINEVPLNGEYYGDYYEEWSVHLDSEPKVTLNDLYVRFKEDVECENCGRQEFGVEIYYDGILRCLDCIEQQDIYSKGELKEFRDEEKLLYKRYLQNKMNDIKEKLENM